MKGPMSEYGSSSTAIAEAMAPAEVCFSGEKTTCAARATW